MSLLNSRVGMAAACLVVALGLAQTVLAQAASDVLITISAGSQNGSKTVVGFVTPSDALVRRVVVEVREGEQDGATLIDRASTASLDRDSGRFTIELGAALKGGNAVVAFAVDNAGTPLAHTPAKVVPAPNSNAIRLPIPSLTAPIREGTRQLMGTIHPPKGITKIEVMIFGQKTASGPPPAAAAAKPPSQANVTAAGPNSVMNEDEADREARRTDVASTGKIDENGLFTISLNHPLIAGQQVEVVAHVGDEQQSKSRSYIVDTFGDWGRVRAYFAGGVIFSKGNDEFSQQDLALTFAMDKTWLQSTDGWITGNRRDTGTFRPREFHSFFDARLTSLPVASPPPAAASAAGTGTAAAATTSSPAAPTKTAATDSSFVPSRKAAMLQVGAYVPLYGRATTWTNDGAPNTLFIAPLVKAGVVTINGDAQSAEGNALGGDDVFSFYAVGLGIGHYKLTGSTDRGSELISYLHATWGRYENFEIHPDKQNPDIRTTPFRLAIEGRLKIPGTAMQVGVDGNFGAGKDDLRFVFGTRFDLGELIGKLKSFSPTGQ